MAPYSAQTFTMSLHVKDRKICAAFPYTDGINATTGLSNAKTLVCVSIKYRCTYFDNAFHERRSAARVYWRFVDPALDDGHL